MKLCNVFRLVVLTVLLTVASHGARAEAFVAPTLANLVKTMIRYGALDIFDDEVIDIYGQTAECRTFHDYYKDEFKWQKIRTILRDSIRGNAMVFPTGYRYETVMKLDRYNFDEKYYPIAGKNATINANTFTFKSTKDDYCSLKSTKFIPENYRFVLNKPVQIHGLPLSEEEGKTLFTRMEKDGNITHLVYPRFNLSVRFIAPIDMRSTIKDDDSIIGGRKAKALASVVARQPIKSDAITLDTVLDSIEYYEDSGRTRLIYVYKP